jgi:hypothetical protein
LEVLGVVCGHKNKFFRIVFQEGNEHFGDFRLEART